jgi:serine/threonine protein phosphatase 1
MSRTIVFGDIHGCLAAFNALLEAIQPQSSDTIVTAGDYVDRGPDSKGVLDRLLELEQQLKLVPLLGNHEEMMLAVLERRMEPYGWLNHGGVETMESYGFNGDLNCVPKSHIELIKRMPSFFETDTHFVVHANYDAQLPLEEQPKEMLRWVKKSFQTLISQANVQLLATRTTAKVRFSRYLIWFASTLIVMAVIG